MNKLISYSLLVGAILIGFNQSTLAGPNFEKRKQVVLEGRQLIHNVTQATDLTKDQKIDILSQAVNKAVYDLATFEGYVDWFIEGINRAVGATPIHLVDGMPPDMENADIPEFLVRQCLNARTITNVRNEVVGAKPSQKIYILALPVTDDEYRRVKNNDDILNLMLNHLDRTFIKLEK